MKKYLIIVIIAIVIIAGLVYYLKFNNHGGISNNTKMCKVSYTASYDTEDILDNDDDYEVVSSVIRLNEIMKHAKKNNYDNRFDKSFFEKMNLLVIQAGLDTEISEKDISSNYANISINKATPLSLPDEEFEFDLYLIPIEKSTTEINVQIDAYSDRLY